MSEELNLFFPAAVSRPDVLLFPWEATPPRLKTRFAVKKSKFVFKDSWNDSWN